KDHVTVRGRLVGLAKQNVYILLNKPKNCITTLRDEKGRATVMDYVQVKARIYPVGRLDRNTTGVLILTNDGEFANQLTHPRFEIEKVYRVTVDKPIADNHVGLLRRGVKLADGIASAKAVEVVKGTGRTKALLAVSEGRNRVVRRMFETLGYDVKHLDRVSFSGITPAGLSRGSWRYMTNGEVKHLKKLAEGIQ
ncbi:MAG TPA: pseudouridine synthase, partial [Bacteroidota bacterium]|nr:pseudouridine synthase [Bacteroidota bacterium]